LKRVRTITFSANELHRADHSAAFALSNNQMHKNFRLNSRSKDGQIPLLLAVKVCSWVYVYVSRSVRRSPNTVKHIHIPDYTPTNWRHVQRSPQEWSATAELNLTTSSSYLYNPGPFAPNHRTHESYFCRSLAKYR